MAAEAVVHKSGLLLKVLLQKISGGYNWEIHCSGGSTSEILPITKIKEISVKLDAEFCQTGVA
jgi:hypothetical protein